MGFNPFRQQVKRRSDLALVVIAVLIVALLVLWAAFPMSPDHDWTDFDGGDDSGAVEVRHVQPYQAEKTYRCPGCDHEIRPGEGHKVVIPSGAPENRRHWHTGCWHGEQRRSGGRARTR